MKKITCSKCRKFKKCMSSSRLYPCLNFKLHKKYNKGVLKND